MRVTLIGPTYPYRGGIAHYTTLLANEFQKTDDLFLCSFKRQYPKWLFPGKSDHEVGGALVYIDVHYLLDSLNPLTWLQAAKRIRQWEPDIVVLQWWVIFWAPTWWILATLLRRWSDARIVFICHNVYSHESRFLDRWLTKRVLQTGHSFVVHAETERKSLCKLLPDASIKVHPHPTYKIFEQQSLTQSVARHKLGIDVNQNVILFFGLVRPYKGLDVLLEALTLLEEKARVILFVVGEFWISEIEVEKLIETLGLKGRVILVNQYIPNDEVAIYFSSADVVVLPYKEATQSGIIQIAYGFNCPVITTQVGGLGEVVKNGETGFVIPPNDSKELAITIQKFFSLSFSERELLRDNIRAEADKFSWSRMVTALKANN